MADPILINEDVLKHLAIESDIKIEPALKKLLIDLDNTFYANLRNYTNLFRELVAVLKHIESEHFKISDLIRINKSVEDVISNYDHWCDAKLINDIFLKRIKMIDNIQVYYLTHILDPRYKDDHSLTDEQFHQANTYFIEYMKLLDYSNKEQELAREAFFNYKQNSGLLFENAPKFNNPIDFWKSFLDYGSVKGLANIGIRLLSIVPHSCNCERMNSIEKHIHSKSRNRLKLIKVEKMLNIKSYLKNHPQYIESLIKSNKNQISANDDNIDILLNDNDYEIVNQHDNEHEEKLDERIEDFLSDLFDNSKEQEVKKLDEINGNLKRKLEDESDDDTNDNMIWK
jgi:hypothetical protein